MISQIKQKGFTIVELLIVIVVIAILAAISIAAYSNITARANTSTATAAAKTVRDVASAYNSANATWPANKSQFTSGGADAIAKLPPDITFTNTLTAGTIPTTGPKTVIVRPVTNSTTGTTVRGLAVTHYDYNTGTLITTLVGETSGGAGTWNTTTGTPLANT